MIISLSGTVLHCEPHWLILEVDGIGYQVMISTQVHVSLNSQLRLYCSHQVREDSEQLYGFLTLAERTLFELLLTVSGVGPKSALGILGIGSVDRIQAAIIIGDPTLFESVSGIGKKAAAKIIVELKTKIGGVGDLLPIEAGADSDLLGALESLGYRRAEIMLILGDLPTDLKTISEKVRWALKQLQ